MIIFFYLKRLIHQNLELDTVELTLPHEYTVRYLLRRAIHIWLLCTLYPEIKWDRPCSSSLYNNHQHVKSKNHSSKYNILMLKVFINFLCITLNSRETPYRYHRKQSSLRIREKNLTCWVGSNCGSDGITMLKKPHDQPRCYISRCSCYTNCTFIFSHLSLSLSLSLFFCVCVLIYLHAIRPALK